MLSENELFEAVELGMHAAGALLCEHDVENRTLVYENDRGNWALVQDESGFQLVSIDGRMLENIETYENAMELRNDISQFVKATFDM